MAYNPLATLVSATGAFPGRWPIGVLVYAAILALFTAVNLRLLRREWAAATEKAEDARGGGLLGPARRAEDAPPPTLDAATSEAAVERFEAQFGYRLRFHPALFYALALPLLGFDVLLAWNGRSAPGGIAFPTYLWIATAMAAVNGCAAFVRDRETGRWLELTLAPLADQTLAAAKLAPSLRSWRPAAVIAATGLALGLLPSVEVEPGWLAWAAITLPALPLSACCIGALLGAGTRIPGEAQWRTSCVFTLLPAALTVGLLFGLDIAWTAAVCPVLGAVAAARGPLPPEAWAGTLLYGAAGAASWWLLRTRLRAVTIGS